MDFHGNFNQPVTLPPTVRLASFDGEHAYSHPLTLPAGLEAFRWTHDDYDGNFALPEGLQKLVWGSATTVTLPPSLRELILTENTPLILPEGLLKITFRSLSHGKYDLPLSVREVVLANYIPSHTILTHPTTLRQLTILESDSIGDDDDGEEFIFNLSNISIHKLTIGRGGVKIEQWPQDLKELEFVGEKVEYPLIVPQGCAIVGEKRPSL